MECLGSWFGYGVLAEGCSACVNRHDCTESPIPANIRLISSMENIGNKIKYKEGETL